MGEDPAVAEIRARLVKLVAEMKSLRSEFDALSETLGAAADLDRRSPTPLSSSSGLSSGTEPK